MGTCSIFSLVLTVFRKKRVHKTVNLLTGKADANPDIVDVVSLDVKYLTVNE